MSVLTSIFDDPEMLTALAALITSFVALGAVIVGPLLTYRYARKQLKESTIIENEKKRIQRFEDLTADFAAVTIKLDLLIDKSGEDWERYQKILDEWLSIKSRLGMLVRRKESDENEFLKLLNNTEKIALDTIKTDNRECRDRQSVTSNINELMSRSQLIVEKRLKRLKQ